MSAQRLTANRNLCPYMHRCYEECYCTSLNSQDVEKVISFCGGSYIQCQVYQVKFSSESDKKTAEYA